MAQRGAAEDAERWVRIAVRVGRVEVMTAGKALCTCPYDLEVQRLESDGNARARLRGLGTLDAAHHMLAISPGQRLTLRFRTGQTLAISVARVIPNGLIDFATYDDEFLRRLP